MPYSEQIRTQIYVDVGFTKLLDKLNTNQLFKLASLINSKKIEEWERINEEKNAKT